MPEEKKDVKSVKPLTLIQKLAAIQLELKAPKNQRNTFGKYNYRSAEDILEAVKPLAIRHGACVSLTDDIIAVGSRIYVKAIVRVINLDDIHDEITTTAMAREEEVKKGMDGSQITGAASSYARKYALNGMFAIDDTKDSDATNDHGVSAQPVKPKTAGDILGSPVVKAESKPKVNPKYREAWDLYLSVSGDDGIDKKQHAANFKKLCVATVNKEDANAYSDADWDSIISLLNTFKG